MHIVVRRFDIQLPGRGKSVLWILLSLLSLLSLAVVKLSLLTTDFYSSMAA